MFLIFWYLLIQVFSLVGLLHCVFCANIDDFIVIRCITKSHAITVHVDVVALVLFSGFYGIVVSGFSSHGSLEAMWMGF